MTCGNRTEMIEYPGNDHPGRTAVPGNSKERSLMEKEILLISECLLGVSCRYDGGSRPMPSELLVQLMERYILVPVCPEQLGGLETPRAPSERQGERVVSSCGKDVTAQYIRGAEQALYLAERFHCSKALLKERSPSCGSGDIYDGSFSGRLVAGSGVTAELLEKSGITVYGESRIKELF